MATTAEMRGAERLRPGWLHGYSTMTQWELADLRLTLPLMVAIQVLAGAGFVLGIGLFFRHIPPTAALYVSTGVPVVNLVLVGLIFGPQVVAEQKLRGTYDYLRALPVPRKPAGWTDVSVRLGHRTLREFTTQSGIEFRYDDGRSGWTRARKRISSA